MVTTPFYLGAGHWECDHAPARIWMIWLGLVCFLFFLFLFEFKFKCFSRGWSQGWGWSRHGRTEKWVWWGAWWEILEESVKILCKKKKGQTISRAGEYLQGMSHHFLALYSGPYVSFSIKGCFQECFLSTLQSVWGLILFLNKIKTA
jgi:hypothetical protein